MMKRLFLLLLVAVLLLPGCLKLRPDPVGGQVTNPVAGTPTPYAVTATPPQPENRVLFNTPFEIAVNETVLFEPGMRLTLFQADPPINFDPQCFFTGTCPDDEGPGAITSAHMGLSKYPDERAIISKKTTITKNGEKTEYSTFKIPNTNYEVKLLETGKNKAKLIIALATPAVGATPTPSATASPEQYFCSDSDGLNPNIKGTVAYFANGKTALAVSDGCTSTPEAVGVPSGVYEYYCGSSYTTDPARDYKFERYDCPGGCVNGACVQPTKTATPAPTCASWSEYREFMQVGEEATMTNGARVKLISILSVPVPGTYSLPATFDIYNANGAKTDSVTLYEGGPIGYQSSSGANISLGKVFQGIAQTSYAQVTFTCST